MARDLACGPAAPHEPASALKAALLALSLGLGGCVERLFFHPDRHAYTTPRALGLAAEDVAIPGPDGSTLHGWFLPTQGRSRGAVLHAHGNAANIGNHLPLVAWLPAAGFDVLMFDYRGFGRSDGRPTLDGVVADTRAALAWLRAHPKVDPARLVVFGQSLGGATAIRAVAADPAGVRLLVVDSAFASYRGIARDAAGLLRPLAAPLLATLPGADADPVTAIRGLRVPVMVIHGSADRVIPLAHGEALYAAAAAPKRWLRVDGGSHMESTMRAPVRAALLEAMVEALDPPAGRAPP